MVTGASGFLGTSICERLVEHGYQVRGLVRSLDTMRTRNPSIDYITGDILDPSSLDRACRNVCAVVHAAGLAHTNNVYEEELEKTNVVGTELIVSATLNNGIRKFIYISSALASKVCDGQYESTKYAQSKNNAERIVSAAHKNDQLEAVILRPVNVYGVGMQGNIVFLMSLIKRGIAPRLPTLNTKVSLVGVRDFSGAVILAVESDRAVGQTYIVTDGQKYNINDIERKIYSAVNRKMPTLKIPGLILYLACLTIGLMNRLLSYFRIRLTALGGISVRTYENLIDDSLYENSEIKRELGFNPKSSLYDTLEEIMKSLKG